MSKLSETLLALAEAREQSRAEAKAAKSDSKFEVAARAVKACVDSVRNALSGDEARSRHHLIHGCLDLLEELHLVPELDRGLVNDKLEVISADSDRKLLEWWHHRSVLCSIEYVNGVWLARRNGICVSYSADRALAVDFAQGDVPMTGNHPNWEVPGVIEAVRSLADEMENHKRG